MELEDRFTVPAPIGDTWAFLNDVPRVIPCMPGAELVDSLGDDAWKARMSVKVGPIALKFDTDVAREVRDEQARRVVLVAKAREVRGRGMATATITSSLSEASEGTEVLIATDLALQGPVAQYGRGMVADISAQMTAQFAERLSRNIGEKPTADGAAPPASGSPAAAAPRAEAAPATPINGLRLVLRALWRRLIGLFKRGGR